MIQSVARKCGWTVMTLLALFVAFMSLRYFAMNSATYFAENREVYIALPIRLMCHIGGGVLAIVIGPFQFWRGFRQRYPGLHRLLGVAYLAATVGFGGIGGLLLAPYSYGGLLTHLGFGVLATLWMVTGTVAFWSILRGRLPQHREWMIRSYALTFAAATLRLWLPALVALGVEFEQAYQLVAWISWVPNLIIIECWLRMTRQSVTQQTTASASSQVQEAT